MFTTIEQVKELTDRDVAQKVIIMAQSIIESYVGRVEIDVINPTDKVLLGKATAYQAAYMDDENMDTVFSQMAVSQVGQMGQIVSFKANDQVSPFVAPLAVIACQRLSWKRMRAVRTGSIFNQPTIPTEWSRD